MLNSMFKIHLDMDDYDILVINDLMRMFIIQLVVQVLFFLRHEKLELFSLVFIENTVFILLGIVVYWIVFNNVIVFTNKDEPKLTDYYQNTYTLNK